jgi:NADPH:quinone reductase-like Zn-dependent oxidoreductase
MKQIILKAPGGLDRLVATTAEDPGMPGAGDIRVRIRANSLNYHDLAVVSGWLPSQDGRVPMSDGAGFVEAVGEGVTEFAVGDMVVSCFFPEWQDGPPLTDDFAATPGDGIDGFAQEIVVRPAGWFTPAPRNLDCAEAACLTTAGVTAWRALMEQHDSLSGKTVLLIGSGGVSLFGLQLAKAAGAKVIITSSSDEKLERLIALGADHGINHARQPEWGKVAHELSGGVDIILETGGPGTLPQSIEAAAIGGCIALIGVLSGFSGEVPTARMMAKQVTIRGITVGSRAHQMALVRMMEDHGIHPVIDRRFALAEIADAFRYQMSGAHLGKICLVDG